ncbi:hypothetical protein OAR00_02290 [Alphaproteobacteria bacterium]|nr:hypothetical protein [Alphaproteobacteria bacterium]
MEPLSIISVIFQLANAAPEIDKLLINKKNEAYTRTEAIEVYRNSMNSINPEKIEN